MMGNLRLIAIATLLPFEVVNGSPALGQSAPSPYTSGTRYDSMGRIVGTISADPDGVGSGNPFLATRISYNTGGLPTKGEEGFLSAWQSQDVDPGNWTGFVVSSATELSYDSTGHKTTELLRGSDNVAYALTQFSYDALGRLECTAVRMNPAAFGSLPASACTLGVQGGQGPDRITRNVYDVAGQRVQVRKAVGTTGEKADATYGFTPNSKAQYVVDANGNKAQMAYDAFDRLQRWYFPSQTRPSAYDDSSQPNALATAGAVNTGDYEEYGYDANGNRTSLRKRDGYTLTYSYDALNRMTTKFVPDGGGLVADHTPDVYYGYDLQGHMTFARFNSASGDGITDGYDGFGELTSETAAYAGVSQTLTYAFDADGNRTRITHSDGAYFTPTYDGLDRTGGASWTNSGGTTPFMSIAFDSAGRRSNINRASSWTAYGYDGIGRLAWMPQLFAANVGNLTQTFGYNPASQITAETRDNDVFSYAGNYNVNRNYTTNGLNQYSAAGSASFTYDANGNLTSDGTNTYVYDRENRLAWASGPTTTAIYYDPLGRLRRTVTSAAVDTWFLYDGDRLIAESAGSNPALITKRFFWGPGSNEPILEDSGGALNCSGTKFLHTDHLGSVVAQADCWGNNTAVNTYDEYGIPGASNVGRFQYTGQMWMPEVGMYYYKARMYSPTLGRFMQTDLIGYKDQINLYAYVGNDPIDRTDPTGECADHYKDGSCKVTVDASTGKIGAAAGKSLEKFLNRYDKAINGLKDTSKYDVLDRKGSIIGSMTGKEIKTVWNGTSFTITNATPNNGGVGGTGGTWNGDSFSGKSLLSPGAVSGYGAAAVARGESAFVGVSTLAFHELGHETHFGESLTAQYPVTPQIDWRREWPTSSAADSMSSAVGAPFDCAIPGGCQ